MLSISLSSATQYLACQQAYYYAYVRRLTRRDRSTAPELGTFLHLYLENYYRNLMQDCEEGRFPNPQEAHERAIISMQVRSKELQGYYQAALAAGAEDLARELAEIPSKAQRIANRYFVTRGYSDAQQYKVLIVEERLRVKLTPTILSTSVIDLVMQDVSTGEVYLCEHKSTQNVPDSERRIRDLQTLLYAKVLEATKKVKVDGILWNYLRTKEPTVPELLKAGGLTTRKDIDTDFDTYSEAITRANLDPSNYSDILERLEDKAGTVFFPRFTYPVIVDPFVVLSNYFATAKEIEAKRKEWEEGVSRPIRNLGTGCQFCDFKQLTMAALTSGDEEDVIRLRYTTYQERP